MRQGAGCTQFTGDTCSGQGSEGSRAGSRRNEAEPRPYLEKGWLWATLRAAQGGEPRHTPHVFRAVRVPCSSPGGKPRAEPIAEKPPFPTCLHPCCESGHRWQPLRWGKAGEALPRGGLLLPPRRPLAGHTEVPVTFPSSHSSHRLWTDGGGGGGGGCSSGDR